MAPPTAEDQFREFFGGQPQSAAVEPTGKIIAGSGSYERAFHVPKSALEKSPVIKGWIEDQESIPASVLKGDALYFEQSDPDVVGATIEYLNSTTNGLIAILNPAGGSKDSLYYVKVYKFALCLGLKDLCTVSLHKIKELTQDTKAFLTVLAVATEDKAGLIDDLQFRDWIMGYMATKSEVLRESSFFKSSIMQDNELAWRLCSLLLSGMTTSSPILTPPRTGSTLEATPKIERRKSSPYSYKPQQKSPSPRQDTDRVKKPQKKGTRNATVEDDYDEFIAPILEPQKNSELKS